MATCQEICTRALRRIRELGAGETASADDSALVLAALNGMLLRWPSQGVDAKYAALALADTFTYFVPPVDATADVIDALDYQGTWNASTNSPTLASATGTKGYFYKVSTAGSTVLDDVSSWAANDYAVFDGSEWLKSIDPTRFEQAVIDLLAVEIVDDFGKEPTPRLSRAAYDGWGQIQAAFLKPATQVMDRALMRTLQRSIFGDEVL